MYQLSDRPMRYPCEAKLLRAIRRELKAKGIVERFMEISIDPTGEKATLHDGKRQRVWPLTQHAKQLGEGANLIQVAGKPMLRSEERS